MYRMLVKVFNAGTPHFALKAAAISYCECDIMSIPRFTLLFAS
jgi:hypothetical protein